MTASEAVLVEIAPADASSPFAAALIESCSAAARLPGGCRLLDERPMSRTPSVIAIVSWGGPERLHVHIQVGAQQREPARWVTRDLDFGATSKEVERWRAVGLVIATVAGEWQGAPVGAGGAMPVPPNDGTQGPANAPILPAPVPGARAPAMSGTGSALRPEAVLPTTGASDDATPPYWLEGLVLLSNNTAGRGLSAPGVALRFSRTVGNPWLLSLGAHYAQEWGEPGGLTLRMGGFEAGAGAFLEAPRLQAIFDVRAQAGAELLAASVHEAAGGERDHGSRWLLFGQLGVTAAWMPWDGFGLLLNGALLGRVGNTDVLVRQTPVARIDELGAWLGAGVRWAVR